LSNGNGAASGTGEGLGEVNAANSRIGESANSAKAERLLTLTEVAAAIGETDRIHRLRGYAEKTEAHLFLGARRGKGKGVSFAESALPRFRRLVEAASEGRVTPKTFESWLRQQNDANTPPHGSHALATVPDSLPERIVESPNSQIGESAISPFPLPGSEPITKADILEAVAEGTRRALGGDAILTTDEAALLLKISPSTLRKIKELKPLRIGRAIRWNAAQIRAYIHTNSQIAE
jgi:predicted DNA-binding transcriptional regulator AlpA